MGDMGDICNRSHQTPLSIRGGIEVDPNRYACTVLEEARAALAKLNWVTMAFSKRHLATLLEELQTIVNRMEAGLEDKSDYSYARDRLRETRAKLKELKAEKAEVRRRAAEERARATVPPPSSSDGPGARTYSIVAGSKRAGAVTNLAIMPPH